MATIPIKAVLSHLTAGEVPVFRLMAKDTKKIGEGEFLRRMSVQTGMDLAQCRYWSDNQRDVLYACLAENCAVDIGYLYAKLYPTGTIPSLTAQPTKAANPVKARAFFKGPFAENVASFDLVNETVTAPAILYEIMQDGASDRNRIESSTARVVINGSAIRIAADQDDNGVWLENLQTGVKVVDATIVYSDASTCHCTFPMLPTTGKYRLVVATRNGENPDEYALAKVTRNVYVVNGGVSHG